MKEREAGERRKVKPLIVDTVYLSMNDPLPIITVTYFFFSLFMLYTGSLLANNIVSRHKLTTLSSILPPGLSRSSPRSRFELLYSHCLLQVKPIATSRAVPEYIVPWSKQQKHAATHMHWKEKKEESERESLI